MTTLLIATTGGHLAQLVDLAPRLEPPDQRQVWVTNQSQQSVSLLQDQEVVWVREVNPRSVVGVIRSVPIAHQVRNRHTVTRAVSTGSAIALGYLPYLAMRGVRCHFIESAARVASPSMTGGVLERMPRIQRYTQYQAAANDKWQYRGSVFDGFEPSTTTAKTFINSIVVTVGTIPEQFPALIDALVPLIGPGGALEQHQGKRPIVLWQTGLTDVASFPIEATPFMPASELELAMANSDLVVGHAGVGSALTSLRVGKHPLLIPRRAVNNEIVDDHQIQVAAELASRGLATTMAPKDLTLASLFDAASRVTHRATAPNAFRLDP